MKRAWEQTFTNSVKCIMKTRLHKTVQVAAVVGGIAALGAGQINSQQNRSNPATQHLTTDWVGSVVYGTEESMDRIAPKGVFPTANPEVQIGLRSDGVVVWRKAPAAR